MKAIRGLRVLMLANASFPIREPFAGGLESWTWGMIHGLRERGAEVTVFAGPGSDAALGAHELSVSPLRLSPDAQSDVSMPSDQYMREHHAYLHAMLLAMRERQFDVIHNASLHYLPVAMADVVGTPMVTTLHTPPTPWLESAFALARSEQTVAAVSRFTASSWSHITRPVVIPNGVDLRRWPAGQGGDALVWHGRITPEKAPHMAIAIAREAGLAIRLAGPISDEQYFETVIRPLLGPPVQYLGHLNQDRLARLVGESAVCLVTPMWEEPYGLVVAESLACGTPVCAFDRGGISELADPSTVRLVSPDDPSASAAAVHELRGANRRAVRAYAQERCSLGTMLDKYCELYQRISR